MNTEELKARAKNKEDQNFLRDGEFMLINNETEAYGLCTVEIGKVQQEVQTENGVELAEQVVYVGALEITEYIDFIDTIRFGNFIIYGVDVNREVITTNQMFVHYDFVATGVNVVTNDMLEEV